MRVRVRVCVCVRVCITTCTELNAIGGFCAFYRKGCIGR